MSSGHRTPGRTETPRRAGCRRFGNDAKYIKHNPQTPECSEGLAALFQRLSRSSPKVNAVRVFEDVDFVFAHTENDFTTRKVGFHVFRFEYGRAVEHWDTTEKIAPRSEWKNDNGKF